MRNNRIDQWGKKRLMMSVMQVITILISSYHPGLNGVGTIKHSVGMYSPLKYGVLVAIKMNIGNL